MKAEDSCAVLRLLFTWSDRTLAQDWQSALKPVPPAGDPEALQELVFRYIALRRGAENWSPRRYDRNNHRLVSNDDVVALLLDARKVDKAQSQPSGAASWRRREHGTPTECAVCRRNFPALRMSARYCSDTCKQTARRVRKAARSAAQGAGGPNPGDPLTPQDGPSEGPDPDEAA